VLIDGLELDLTGLQIRPGLINAHDHLEFSLFPKLGSGLYRNAADWARDIYRPNESPVREHLRVPKTVRLLWGGLRNLLSGVTTVCHHNPYHPIFDADFPVRVVKDIAWAHSVAFSSDLRESFAAASPRDPFVLHAGEGVDPVSAEEAFLLDRMGLLGPRTVLVHAVGFDRSGWDLVRRSGASVIWCPRSNLAILGRTMDIGLVREMGIPIALGTDSPLTAGGDLLDEIQFARDHGVGDDDIARWTGEEARHVLKISGEQDDFIAVREFGAAPELVVCRGHVQLISERLARGFSTADLKGWFRLHVQSRPPVFVRVDTRVLMQRTLEALGGGPICLGGREVYS
jgi:cytosine/adenosine deaminase-related metal-dependent hydrolase